MSGMGAWESNTIGFSECIYKKYKANFQNCSVLSKHYNLHVMHFILGAKLTFE